MWILEGYIQIVYKKKKGMEVFKVIYGFCS